MSMRSICAVEPRYEIGVERKLAAFSQEVFFDVTFPGTACEAIAAPEGRVTAVIMQIVVVHRLRYSTSHLTLHTV